MIPTFLSTHPFLKPGSENDHLLSLHPVDLLFFKRPPRSGGFHRPQPFTCSPRPPLYALREKCTMGNQFLMGRQREEALPRGSSFLIADARMRSWESRHVTDISAPARASPNALAFLPRSPRQPSLSQPPGQSSWTQQRAGICRRY